MEITQTYVEIVGTGQEFNIPGDLTAAQFVSSYANVVAGLASMNPTTTVEGSTRRITFTQRTGNKG